MKNLENTFEYMRDAVELSEDEKATGRAGLVAFMQERPMRSPLASPLRLFALPFLRYGMAALLFVALGGGGVAYAAKDADPTDALYVVRVKVDEPVQVALIFDKKDRADLEVELVNKRLKEAAEVAVADGLTEDQVGLVADSLTDHINGAQEAVTALHGDDHPDDALDTANNLSATLSAHAAILEKVQEANPETAQSIDAIVSTLSGELTETDDLVDTAQDAVENSTTPLSQPADEQAVTAAGMLDQVRAEVADALNAFDPSDRSDLNESLAEVEDLIAQAQVKDAAGDSTDAYLLYSDASQRLTALQLAIEADQTLHMDLIDATTTDPEGAEEQ
jgi:hypothetical protein